MEVHKGTRRLAIVIPSLGIAIKLPRLRVREVLMSGWEMFQNFPKHARRIGAKQAFLHMVEELLDPVRNNWLEFYYYFSTRHPFLQPTYFSLFGLCNIQQAGQQLEIEDERFWEQMRSLTEQGIHGWHDNHHFYNRDNFCWSGHLRILDYGSPLTIDLVKRYGQTLLEKFCQ